ncbi:MAG: DUF5615 family PIN-like protein [Polyangiaceae bacterium]|nr:DUF5615 family PIN-like protein [Polyangiaceae bacterium]
MRVKLDENLGVRGAALLTAAGVDVDTVAAEDLCGTSDKTLAEVCRVEHRVLVTLDKDFADTLRFPPQRYAGIVVLRLGEPLTHEMIQHALRRFVDAVDDQDLSGRLWIVDSHRIREFLPASDRS